jgi:hypothetical protein
MQDGRFISSYIRSRSVDQFIKNINNLDSAHDYKIFLQDNTTPILTNLNYSLKENNMCNKIPCNQTDLKKLVIKPKYISSSAKMPSGTSYQPIDTPIDIGFASYNI